MVDIKKETKNEEEIPKEITTNIEEIIRRLKILEERYSNIRKKIEFTEQTIIKDTKVIYDQLTLLENNITEINSEFSDITDKMNKMIEEINQTVKKSEFNVLAKYFEFWQPMEFLTRVEAEKLINELKYKKR